MSGSGATTARVLAENPGLTDQLCATGVGPDKDQLSYRSFPGPSSCLPDIVAAARTCLQRLCEAERQEMLDFGMGKGYFARGGELHIARKERRSFGIEYHARRGRQEMDRDECPVASKSGRAVHYSAERVGPHAPGVGNEVDHWEACLGRRKTCRHLGGDRDRGKWKIDRQFDEPLPRRGAAGPTRGS